MGSNLSALALVFAALTLAGCAGTGQRSAPGVTVQLSAPTATAKAVTPTPVPQEVALQAQQETPLAAPVAKAPEQYDSLQPFRKFKKGDGEGVAREYLPRDKAAFVALLRDAKAAKRMMRVGCEKLVAQMMEAHPELPFEGCEGAAAAITGSDDFQVVACKDEMFLRDNWLTVTNRKGSAWGAWHRKCLPREKVLVFKNQPLISTTCFNVAIPVKPAVPLRSVTPAVPAPLQRSFADASCPSGYTLVLHAWQLSTIPDDLRPEAKRLISAANARDSAEATDLGSYQVPDFSRTLGGRLRKSGSPHAVIGDGIVVRLLNPQTAKVVRELGTVTLVRGAGSYGFSEDPRAFIVETIWPADFSSPALSGGKRRLRLFPEEWGKFCTMNEHGAIP